MTQNTHDRSNISPFIAQDQMFLADVIEHLDQVEDLSPTRKRDLKSAIRSIARLVHGSLETTPANINWLNVRLRRVHPAEANISKKRFQNIKSDALKALELVGASRSRKDWLSAPSDAWQALLDDIPDKHDRWKLTQLAQYCSAIGCAPSHVTDQVLIDLLKVIMEESFQNRPEHVVANAIKAWNGLRREIDGWPDIALSPLPPKKPRWTFPLDTFPESFQADVASWLDRLSNPDLLDGSGPAKPLRPSTVAHRRFQIQEAASALVRSGRPQGEVTSLAMLVDLKNLKAALRWMMDLFDGKPTEAIKGVAICLQAIAKHHVKLPDDDIAQVKGIITRMGREDGGLREKNRLRLLQLEDPGNLAKLLHLPTALVTEAERLFTIRPRKAALLLQAALGIEILLNAPMRISNLATLHLTDHMRPHRVGRERRTHIHIPPQEVKNNVALDYELGDEATSLLDIYLRKARPILLVQPSDYLFPARNGGPKPSAHLSRLIKETILEHTGLTIHAHLFRSIAGKIHSLAQPGDFVTLAYVLNDSLKTAMKSYAQFERRSALEHYQASVAAARKRKAP